MSPTRARGASIVLCWRRMVLPLCKAHSLQAVSSDGLCVDAAGNLWVATQDAMAGQRLQVFAPDGTRWGMVSIPFAATRCAFGDADLRTLYLTAGSTLYRMSVPIPGRP